MKRGVGRSRKGIVASAAWLALSGGCAGDVNPDALDPASSATDPGHQTGPFDISIASSPPIAVPAALWLDANYGIAHDGTEARAWTDRSGFGLVFQGDQSASAPTLERLAGQGALRFAGRARLALSPDTDPRGRAALTIGTRDFLLALVLRRDEGAGMSVAFTLAPDASGGRACWLALAPTPRFALADGRGTNTVVGAGALVAGEPHLVVVTSVGGALALRIDGAEVATQEQGRLVGGKDGGAPVELPYLVPRLGGDDQHDGLTGVVGDVVLLAGPSVADDLAPIEKYLREKYHL
jgi:hypothetical protein